MKTFATISDEGQVHHHPADQKARHEAKDPYVVYICNSCKNTNANWHCSTCNAYDLDLCQACYEKSYHEHEMEQIKGQFTDKCPRSHHNKQGNKNKFINGSAPSILVHTCRCQDAKGVPQLITDKCSGSGQKKQEDVKEKSIKRCTQSLIHACRCQDHNCRTMSCHKMRRVVGHAKVCKRRQSGSCPVCKQLLALCCYHAKQCKESECPVPFCQNIRRKLAEKRKQEAL